MNYRQLNRHNVKGENAHELVVFPPNAQTGKMVNILPSMAERIPTPSAEWGPAHGLGFGPESLFDVTTSESGIGRFAGKHVLAELEGVEPDLLDDVEGLREMLHSVLTRSGATVREVLAHRFAPQGVTVLAMLTESHASVHTYPEIGAAFVDVFTCGRTADPELAVDGITVALGARSVRQRTVPRGWATSAQPLPAIERTHP